MPRKQMTAWFRNARLAAWVACLFHVLSAHAADASVGQKATRIFEWSPFLAPFHSVVLHFPIGFITVAVVVELYRMRRPSDDLRRVTILVTWMALVTGVISALFGWMRAGTGGYQAQTLETHRLLGMTVPFLTLLALLFLGISVRRPAKALWTAGSRLTLAATLLMSGIAGHYGGALTHGANYLTENAPVFVRELMENSSSAPAATLAAQGGEKQRFYVEKVQPILSTKCVNCHGPEKHKGDLRLDTREAMLKGGESGKAAVKPGDPFESHLVRLIFLPPDHEEAMPPAGKQPLSIEEIGVLIEWIRNGAVMPETPPNGTPSPHEG